MSVVVTVFACAPLGAQMIPDAPVRNFSLPSFGKFGYKEWEFGGTQGIYIDENRIDVVGLRLRTFTGGRDLRLDTIVESPQATVFHTKSEAHGKGSIQIRGNRFTVEGTNWSWEGKKKTFTVRSRARVSFAQSLDHLLLK